MSEIKILCKNNGPLLIQGKVNLTDAEGNSFDLTGKETFALCRCGSSENAPFCDGTHGRKGFASEIKAR